MKYKLSGNPYEYMDKIQNVKPRKDILPKEEGKTEKFWDQQSSANPFKPHPDARKSILYKPVNR